MSVGKHHFHRTGYDYNRWQLIWMFTTSPHRSILFHFSDYDCYTCPAENCNVNIGDGLTIGQFTLMHAYGRSTPNDVISSGASAWLESDPSALYELGTSGIPNMYFRFRLEISSSPGIIRVDKFLPVNQYTT